MIKSSFTFFLLIFLTSISINSFFIQTNSQMHPSNSINSFESFYDFLAKYTVASEEEKAVLLNDYILWQESAGGFPAIQNNTHVVFIYYNPIQNINQCLIVGDFTIWDGVNMTKLDFNVSFFYLGYSFEPKSRIDYMFIINDNWINDPRNPNQSPADVGVYYSELRMPEFIQPQEILFRTNITHGSITNLKAPWTNPQVKVYLPPNYNTKLSYPTAFVADGSNYLDIMSAGNVLDNLIADKRIEPIILVFTDPKDFPDPYQRFLWYKCNPEYLTFLDSLVDYIDSTYATNQSAYARLHMGYSAGGLVSAYAVIERPNTFKLLASQSGAFWAGADYGIKQKYLIAPSSYQFKTWFSVGTYENNNHNHTPMVNNTQEMVEICENNNWLTKAVYNPECHSYGAWRHLFDDILEYFFPYKEQTTKKATMLLIVLIIPLVIIIAYTQKQILKKKN